MRFSNFLKESEQPYWYHGRSVDSDVFDFKYIKLDGTMQDGPGFYFTKDIEDAKIYKGDKGIILKCELTPRKIINKNSKISPVIIKKSITLSPNLNDFLENWDENKTIAFNKAYKALTDNDSMIDIFQSIWYDCYGRYGRHIDFVKNMVKLGLDATEPLTESFSHKHIIMFNPEKIKVLEIIR